eukprot:SAG31_NODE_6794_length_1885_cov_1.020717_2_plen_345_part_00
MMESYADETDVFDPPSPPNPGRTRGCRFAVGPAAHPSRYLVEEQELGEGAGGTVYRAINALSHQTVVIKIVRSPRPYALNEAQSMQILSGHKNIVHYLGHFDDASTNDFCIVMECIDGKDLFDTVNTSLARGQSYSTGAAKNHLMQLLRALDHIHRHGMEHGDVKLENVMLETDSAVIKLIDFGTCMPLDRQWKLRCKGGTPAYNAPEKNQASAFYDGKKSDIFSAGIVCFALLAGSLPTVSNIQTNCFPDCISKIGTDFLQKMLAIDPQSRYSAADLLEHDWLQTDHLLPVPAMDHCASRVCQQSRLRLRKRKLDDAFVRSTKANTAAQLCEKISCVQKTSAH